MYRNPYWTEAPDYADEPTDEQATALARALAHWIGHYLLDEQDRTAQSIVLDILESNGASDPQMTRDECVAIAKAVGVAV